MEASKTQYADDISQFSSAGLIIRQKEPKNLEAPSTGSTRTSPRMSFSTYAVIFRYQTWIAPLTNYASKVR